MGGIKKKTNINDIALAAGVSKTTVSRYLNGRTDLMSEQTQKRIKAVIEIANYHPSDTARNMKLKHTNLIGVVVADMTSPYSSALISSISEYLNNYGYVPLIANSNNSLERESEIINLFFNKNVAGLMVNTTSFINPHLIAAACNGIPIVLCGRYVQDHKFNIVAIDNYSAMYKIVDHLKLQGYTRPVLFTQDWKNNSSRSFRKDAFVSAVKTIYGYDPHEDIYVIERRDGTEGSTLLARLMDSLKNGDIPAIIGINTITTVLAYKAVKSLNLKIPTDIGICGPDDWDWQSDMTWPLLIEPHITTFSIPTKEIGRRAAALLLDVIKEPDRSPQEILLLSELEIRESTLRSL